MTSSDNQKPVLVLGAGCAGLSAALRLVKKGHRVILLEKDDHVGGLAGGVNIKGNTYEYGPHAFHTTDPEILGDIKDLMGPDLISYKRTIKIKFLGNYFKFPLSMPDVMLKLPFRTLVLAFFSFIWDFVTGSIFKPKVETSETILKRYYGNVLYEIFFKSYIINVWGIPPAQFSPAFAKERIPRLNILDFIDKIYSLFKNRFKQKVKTENYVERVEGSLYTTRQGFSLITQRMAEKIASSGGQVLLNTSVLKITREGKKISSVRVSAGGKEQELECCAVINTLPVNEIMDMIEPRMPAEIMAAAGELKFRALVFVGVHVSRKKVLPSSFMYFRQHSFNRISDLGQFGFEIKPEGSTVLIAEISCDADDKQWNDEAWAKEAVVADLVREKLLENQEVLSVDVFRARHAYPIYTLDYEKHLTVLLNAVEGMANMETAGRQGRFQYINTHIAMKMGYEAADRLAEKIKNAF